MVRTKADQVSILGDSYFQPIADLIDRWLARPRPRSTSVQSAYFENGYAASVVLLLVAMFESYVVRVRYIQRATVPKDLRNALDVLNCLYPRLRHRKALVDVYVLRDTIFHNHLWEIDYFWGGSPSMVLRTAVKHAAFRDRKYSARVNPNTRRTKALGLSVVPTRVDRRDVKRVFGTVWKTLLFLESKNRNQCHVSGTTTRFRGKAVPFGDLIGYL